jgi:hypothetical protein
LLKICFHQNIKSVLWKQKKAKVVIKEKNVNLILHQFFE